MVLLLLGARDRHPVWHADVTRSQATSREQLNSILVQLRLLESSGLGWQVELSCINPQGRIRVAEQTTWAGGGISAHYEPYPRCR